MRSQASKPLPKKGALSKTPFKPNLTVKQIKKKAPTKKAKNLLNKTSPKNTKKSSRSDESSGSKDHESSDDSKQESSTENIKAGPSKTAPKNESTPKNIKKESPKTSVCTNVKKIMSKKSLQTPKETKKNVRNKIDEKSILEAKDKDSSEISQKSPKVIKSKPSTKKGQTVIQKKKYIKTVKSELHDNDQKSSEIEKLKVPRLVEDVAVPKSEEEQTLKKKDSETKELNLDIESTMPSTPTNVLSPSQTEFGKVETDRPPKFFTSSRSPRTVDIDVKCLKNSKGNLSVSERFLSMKCETKNDDAKKEKSLSNTLVSPGPEIDVYTFTEKVDSPKSILSDFRSPINKNIGRVRPIARVKGTVIDKKTEAEKKKYSPHRPIEEVVKQLKANKRNEEINLDQQKINDNSSVFSATCLSDFKEFDDVPQPILSKSYTKVARKSSVTGKPFSPLKFFDQDPSPNKYENTSKSSPVPKKSPTKCKKNLKTTISDEDIENSKFSFNPKSTRYTSSDESVSESNDDNDIKESSGSDNSKTKKTKNKKYKRITDNVKKSTSKELKELSKDSLIDLKEDSFLLGSEKPSKRRLKLLSLWAGPKKHRMASLNAIAKVHCLYENESRTHMELGLMKTIERQALPSTSKVNALKKKDSKAKEIDKHETTSESEYENKKEKREDSSESSDDNPPQRSLRGVPGIRSAGKYWDPKSSTSSSEDSEMESKKKTSEKKKSAKTASTKSDPPAKMKKTAGVPVKKKRNRNEIVMDLKDMVVQKRMASLNATAILAASYEKRSPKSSKDGSTSDSCSDESFTQKPKNGVGSGVKSESKIEDVVTKKEDEENSMSDKKQKVEVIVNQDTDVTITGVYSTHHHEGFCTVAGMQYRISSTSHTQTTATANCEKEGCSKDEPARYTPLTALSSMQPPAEHVHTHSHPVAELGGLGRRAGCSSAFSAPTTAHHEPGYYQPAGPLIKETSSEAERALARYHPPPHYHPPHPPVLPQYGPHYYPDLCYGRPYYRPSGSYHMPPPQPDAPMVGVGGEPYPQYYGTPPCYQHSPQRIPYVEFRGCPCPLNACPKNVLIGPATGKAPTGGGPADVSSALAPSGASFRAKLDAADTHGSGKDPPLAPEPPAAADAPHPCPVPAIGGASPKRELYDVRENLRLAGDLTCPTEALGPPSPARGSAGACPPQPPPVAPRRARLGKEMARRSLAVDDTGQLLLTVPPKQPVHHHDVDDDVMAISPPLCAPIDLSSSDERSTPLVDIKKENEGPISIPPRKTDAQALKEHNGAPVLTDFIESTSAAKAAKRRYSKPKLEIEMKDVHLEDTCKTNGIGEHVKLQKRRKVSNDQPEIVRTETITKEIKKKAPQKTKRSLKNPLTEKKTVKRKLLNSTDAPLAKKINVDIIVDDLRLKSVAAAAEDPLLKPKTKSALLLDDLLRKNSIDRADPSGYDCESKLNPAELFLPVNENCTKKTLNINNNIVEKKVPDFGVRPKTITDDSQLVMKKAINKTTCKIEKVDSKILHSLKSVLKTPTEKPNIKEEIKALTKCEPCMVINSTSFTSDKINIEKVKSECDIIKDKCKNLNRIIAKDNLVSDNALKCSSVLKSAPISSKSKVVATERLEESQNLTKPPTQGERVADTESDMSKKRCKLSEKVVGELKVKSVEKVAKLLVSKKLAIKADEASLVVEDACASPVPCVGRRQRRRRSIVSTRRQRRPPAPVPPPDLEPRAPPRWSNGWNWDGEPYISKVYLNNDSRLDRTARCWTRMWHASGDRVARGDCVLLRAAAARAQPFVARIARLWENPDDGEMMVSLVWYYRPEHTELGRMAEDAPDEVFASRHRDANSVACIEDKCYVLTYNEYCRYRKRLKAAEEGIVMKPSIVPPMPASEITPAIATNDSKLPNPVSPELVLFCRKIYDFRSKKIQAPNK